MQKILVIHDDSAESLHAAEYAFSLARTYEKELVICSLAATDKTKKHTYAHANDDSQEPDEAEVTAHFILLEDRLRSGIAANFSPQIRFLSDSSCDEKSLISFINSEKVWMVVVPAMPEDRPQQGVTKLNLQSVINSIQTPVMIVPRDTPIKPVERIVYVADLRYAQIPVLNYLSRFNRHEENIILAHRCASGLPELDRNYADELFSGALCRHVNSQRIYLTQMREKSIEVVIDGVINGMGADMLVCVNRHFHFSELVGKDIMCKLPSYVNIPMLIFPN